MKSKHLLLALLLALMAPWAVAQQSLPYSYGFENGNLATDGWTNTGGGISNYYSDGIHSGSYYFYFYWNISTDVYLVSPLLTGAETQGLDVTFWYKALDEDYLDIFKVGYTTDANNTDPSTFTYGEDYITASTDWVQYEETFPAGTVRVAIMYDADNYDYGDYLALDDFVFDVHSNCAKPEDLNIAYTEGETTATVTWTSDAPSFNINVNGVTETVATNSYTIENIEPLQSFNVSVQAVCAEEPSGWVSESFFSGCPETFAIPYAEGFENPNTINCWTLSPANNMGVDATEPDYAHTGNNFLILSYTTNPPQYVISPELSGIQNGLHVEFYYRQYTQGVETFHVGYSTTDNDPDSFEWGEEITASTTYQRFSANYPAGTKYVAIKHTANDQYYLFLDDFLFEEVASCMETAITGFTNVSTEGATANWNEASGRVTYDLYVTTDATDVPDDATTPTASGINGTSYPLTSLNSGTNYYVYVRVVCSATDHSAWSPAAVLTTVCETIPLPYSYDFNDEELPVCWNVINTNTSYNDIRIMKLASDNPDAVLAMFFGSYATADLIAVLPEIDETYDVSNYQIEFDACYANSSSTSMTSGSIGIGVMTDPNDASTFELVEQVSISDSYSTSDSQYGLRSHKIRLNTYEGSGKYIAIKDIRTSNGFVLVDNVSVTQLPACLEPTNVDVDGGMNAVVTWEGDADDYDIAFSDDNTVDPDEAIVGSTTEGALSFNLGEAVTLTEGDYFVWVRAKCGETDGNSPWVGPFDLHVGYCIPAPTNVDGDGITNVTFGKDDDVVNIDTPTAAYTDYTSEIGGLQAGVASTIAITTGTGSYPYAFVIWVDLDNSLTFDDDEMLYVGQATSGDGTLNATITIPADQALGDYRMRIYGADMAFDSYISDPTTTAPNACTNYNYATCHDYTVRVLEAPDCLPASDLDANNFTTESADLIWTAANGETAWTLIWTDVEAEVETELNITASDPEVIVDGTTVTYTLEGLNAGTYYSFYVVSNCSESDSDPSIEFYFITECGAFDLPHEYGFDDVATSINSEINCWYFGNIDEDNDDYNQPGFDYRDEDEGDLMFYFSSSNYNYGSDYEQYLISPELNTTEAVRVEFEYSPSYTSSMYPESFMVGYSSVLDLDEFTWDDEIVNGTSAWCTYSKVFPAGTKYVAILYTSEYSYSLFIDNFKFEEVLPITQTIELTEGWNWVSIPVAVDDPIDMLDMLTESIGDNATEIQSFDFMIEYDGEEWEGDLNDEGLANEQMYLINAIADCSITLQGMPAFADNYTITINPGWNWIGFPSSEPIDVADAMANFEAEAGDEMQSFNDMTEYDGEDWEGDLETFEPGQGILYNNTTDEVKTLVFSTGAKKIAFNLGTLKKQNAKKMMLRNVVVPAQMEKKTK